MTKLDWEKVESTTTDAMALPTMRAKVPGGWLVSVSMADGVGLTFLPDTEHQWGARSPNPKSIGIPRRRYD